MVYITWQNWKPLGMHTERKLKLQAIALVSMYFFSHVKMLSFYICFIYLYFLRLWLKKNYKLMLH